MSVQGLITVALCGLLQAASNLLLRRGVLLAVGPVGDASIPARLMAWAQQPLFLLGVLLYGLTALIWFSVLSREALSSAYPTLVGITFALVVVGSVAFFQEQVSFIKFMGIVLILAGVILLSRT